MTRAARVGAGAALALALACGPAARHWRPTASSAPSGTKDFTLRWDRVDPNGFPLNPYWGAQAADPARLPPSSAVCSATPDLPACTDQSTSRDLPAGLSRDICGLRGGDLAGHVNWMPTAYTGRVSWSNLASDGDVNLLLEPDERFRGLTGLSDLVGGDLARPALHVEFASNETLWRFATGWWQSLGSRVDEWARMNADADRIENWLNRRHPGLPPRGIVIGLLGLDCEHGCKSELHPAYAVALEVDDNPRDNTWVIFARNWGTEGFCSQLNHWLDLPQNLLRVTLPTRGARAPRVIATGTQYAASDSGAPAPVVSWTAEAGVVVTFALPDPIAAGLAELVLHLAWEDGPADPIAEPPSTPLRAAPAPNIGLVVGRAGDLGQPNAVVSLARALTISPGPREIPELARSRAGWVSPETLLAAKRRGEAERLRWLCREVLPLSDTPADRKQRICAGVR